MPLPRGPFASRKAATVLLDRLVDPPMRRNFLVFLADYALFGAGFIAFFRRDALQEGYYEFQDLGRQLREKLDEFGRR